MAKSNKASKMRLLAMAPDDAKAFSECLREAFPNIRLTNYQYGSVEIRKGGRLYRVPKKNLQYFDSLAEGESGRFVVWLQPEGWKPLWTGPNENDVFVISNEPTNQFVYESSHLNIPYPDNLRCGRIWAYYKKVDKEHLRFLNRVWRISAKLTTNVVDVLDMKTLQVRYPSQKTMLWVGYHALDWCRAYPARTIDENVRPVDIERVH